MTRRGKKGKRKQSNAGEVSPQPTPPEQQGTPRKRGPAYYLLVVMVNAVLIVVGFELALRMFVPDSLKEFHHFKRAEKREKSGEILDFVRSDDSILIYENRPNHTRESGVFTGDHGVIGKLRVALKKRADIIRILVLGDSIGSIAKKAVTGDDMGPDKLFTTLLENALNEKELVRGKKFEVLNLTTNGYTALQEGKLLELRGSTFSPDIVIWQYCLNDPVLSQPSRYFLREYPRFYISEFIGRHLGNRLDSTQESARFMQPLPCYRGPLGKDPNLQRYWAWVYNTNNYPWRVNVLKGYRIAAEYAEEKSIPIVQVIFPIFPETGQWKHANLMKLYQQVADAARDHGFYSLNLVDEFSKHPPTDMYFPYDIFHPTVKGHAVAARSIHDYLRDVVVPRMN